MAAINWALMFCAILQPTVAAGVRKLSGRVEMCSEMSGDSCVVTASGVAVADRLKVTRRSDLEMDDIELIWLELQERATRRALFGAAHRPPRSQ